MRNLLIVLSVVIITIFVFTQKSMTQWGNNDVKSISGTITDNQRPCAFLKGSDGNTYRVHMGPVWYWNQNNYDLKLSDATIKGDVKVVNGEYNIYPYTIEQGEVKMVFTDDNGVPKWRNGKGNGNGWGKGNCCNGNGRGNGNCRRNK
jgi:hypothetical protein